MGFCIQFFSSLFSFARRKKSRRSFPNRFIVAHQMHIRFEWVFLCAVGRSTRRKILQKREKRQVASGACILTASVVCKRYGNLDNWNSHRLFACVVLAAAAVAATIVAIRPGSHRRLTSVSYARARAHHMQIKLRIERENFQLKQNETERKTPQHWNRNPDRQLAKRRCARAKPATH